VPPAARRALLAWYEAEARDLPWRCETDPYRVWLSEVMLQQTRVAAAVDRYGRFLRRFPTLVRLARAHESEVLEEWAGLGYYGRARKLHAAARACAVVHGGEVPADPRDFAALPGVGPYTTGAVMSIAFDAPLPAVDGNVIRVLARLLRIEQDVTRAQARHAIDAAAREAVQSVACDDERPAGHWNQALMELGALVCTPRSPRCDACPIERWCAARAAGIAARLPRKPPKRAQRVVEVAAACVVADRRLLVVRRPARGLLAGMWGLPMVEGGAAELEAGLGAKVEEELVSWRHVFSHRVWNARLFAVSLREGAPGGARWWDTREVRPDRFPTAFRPAVTAALSQMSPG
jgi:A/G-specific adenine glycosylase